jgi:hypothetical protein
MALRSVHFATETVKFKEAARVRNKLLRNLRGETKFT